MHETALDTFASKKRWERLRKLIVDERRARKLRQQQLARRLGQHQSWVSRLENTGRRIDVLEFLDLVDALGSDPIAVLRKFRAPDEGEARCETGCNDDGVDEALAVVKAAGYRVTKPRAFKSKVKASASLGLNAIGKPFSPQYDPRYRMKYKPSYGHLRAPYGPDMRFVGDPPVTENPPATTENAAPLPSPADNAVKAGPEATTESGIVKTKTFWLSFTNENEVGGFAIVDVHESEIGKAGALFAAIRKSLQLGINPGPDYIASGREIEPNVIPEEFRHRLLGHAEAASLGGKLR
jgi:transcriptional regulator with XRE-family HTH domain